MARRANIQFDYLTGGKRDRVPRSILASAGGPAGRPTGKRRATKPRRRKRR